MFDHITTGYKETSVTQKDSIQHKARLYVVAVPALASSIQIAKRTKYSIADAPHFMMLQNPFVLAALSTTMCANVLYHNSSF